MCYLEAAENGYAEAQNELGIRYLAGNGVEQDNKKASEWFQKAANQENASSEFFLGLLLAGDEKYQDAFYWIKKAADRDFSIAQAAMASFYLDSKLGGVDKKVALEWIDRSLADENWFVDFLVGYIFLAYFCDYKKAELYLKKASEEEDIFGSKNWLSVICFAQNRNKEGFRLAEESAKKDDPLGCFILSNAYYHGKGTKDNQRDKENGDLYYKKAIDNGLSIDSDDAMALDVITEKKKFDIDRLYSDRSYLSELLSSGFFPKTDFILAKMQKKKNKVGHLTIESVKGTETRALSNILGLRPIIKEEEVKRKLKKDKRLLSSDDSLLIGGSIFPEYYAKKLESLDYSKIADPGKYLDNYIWTARSSMDDYWKNDRYKDIKKVFDYLSQTEEGMKQFEEEGSLKETLKKLFPEEGERAIDSLFLDVREEYLRRCSSTVSISPSDSENDQPRELRDESTPSAEEVFFSKEDRGVRLLKLKQFVVGFDSKLRKNVSKDISSVFMIRLLVPSPAKETESYFEKYGLSSIVNWINKVVCWLSIDEIKEILAETEHFSTEIDWFLNEQIKGERVVNNKEISERLGIKAPAFTTTVNKTLIPGIKKYWESNRTQFEVFDD